MEFTSPYENLRMVLLDKGIPADQCGVLRPGQHTGRPHRVVDGIDMKACGFKGPDLDMIVVHYEQPKPPEPPKTAAEKVREKLGMKHHKK